MTAPQPTQTLFPFRHVCLGLVMITGCGLFAGGTLPANAADSMVIGTLNCHFLVRSRIHVKFGAPLFRSDWSPEDEKLWGDDAYAQKRFDESLAAIAKVVHRLNADILVLEEVGGDGELERLRKQVAELGVTYPYSAICECTDTYTQQYVAVLSKRKITEVLGIIPGRESYDRELDDVESEDETGLSKGLRFVVDFDNEPFYIYGVHFTSERGGHESDGKRIAQASIIRRHYLPLLNADKHVIVIGDLNDHRGQPTLRRIRGRDDIWADLVQTGGPTFTKRRSKEPLEEYNARLREHYTFEWVGKPQQIDHILISRSIRNLCLGKTTPRFVTVTEKVGDSTMPATDHRAMLLKLETRK
ncbi:MAG: endonuclease/exonuclease/phosphatase family protein [bacterium]|nr:endonuclease/exonuclease/phosphatase family protein [bacterium]